MTMKRIGLITDTHIPWVQKELPRQVMETFRGVDLILHAGDIYSHTVLDQLESVAPVLAALGDDDYADSDPRVKEKHVLEIEGHRIWLIHEGPYNATQPWLSFWWQNRISPQDEKYGKPDIIICGHEHRTAVERFDGIMCINSGSPTYLEYRSGLGTVGILELEAGKKADVRIVQLQS